MTGPESLLGVRLELTVGPVAHGGHFVARADDGRVVFVRHSLPGERVIAEVTEERTGYLRADTVEVLSPSPDRVSAPCRFAGADLCGGCDFQHVAVETQLELKTAVVVEQLTRLARLTPHEIETLGVRVTALPGGPLGWRTRVRYTVDASGRAGLLKHRSHEVVPIDVCVIATEPVNDVDVPAAQWPDDDAIEVVASTGGDVSVAGVRPGRPSRLVEGSPKVHETLGGRTWTLDPATFWQIHPYAPDVFVATAIEMLAPAPGEKAWDLYGGAGVFAGALAERVGATGHVTLIESDDKAVVAASTSLADLSNVTIIQSLVERMKVGGRPDLVILDPPRSGAGARVVRMLIEAAPRAICYVACDPAALARDIATFRASGWELTRLRAFDAFPMTHHVECVALLQPGPTL